MSDTKPPIIHPAERDGWAKPEPRNSMWAIGKGQWAIGIHVVCEAVRDRVPDDAVASWVDNSNVRFCIRKRPADMPKDFDETKVVEVMQIPSQASGLAIRILNLSVAVFRIGNGVLVKSKWLGMYGSANEGAAMHMIREKAPSVPVPETLCHWRDPDWFCYFTIMREVQGVTLASAWWGLEEEHRRRLVRECSLHIQAVGNITSPLAVTAHGRPVWDGILMPEGTPHNDDVERTGGHGPFTTKQFHEWITLHRPSIGLPPSLGEPNPPTDINFCHNFPQERQAGLHVTGIIDWERSGFFPRFMVTWQFRQMLGGLLPCGDPGLPPYEREDDFTDVMLEDLVEIGCDNLMACGYVCFIDRRAVAKLKNREPSA